MSVHLSSEGMRRQLVRAKQKTDINKRNAALARLLLESGVKLSDVEGDADAIAEIDRAIRRCIAAERGLVRGTLVMYSRVALPARVRGLSQEGYVRLEGGKFFGKEFHPKDVIRLE